MRNVLVMWMFSIVVFVGSPAEVRAQGIDARFRADIERLLDVTGAKAAGAQMAALVADQMLGAIGNSQGQVPERAMAIIKETLSAEFGLMFDGPNGLTGRMVDIYAKHFTHDDVLALLKFYGTDVGRKLVQALPALAQEGAEAGQAWAEANMSRIGALVEERLRASGVLK